MNSSLADEELRRGEGGRLKSTGKGMETVAIPKFQKAREEAKFWQHLRLEGWTELRPLGHVT